MQMRLGSLSRLREKRNKNNHILISSSTLLISLILLFGPSATTRTNAQDSSSILDELFTDYINPSPTPTFDLSYDVVTKNIIARAELSYITAPNVLYTYVFQIGKPWQTDISSLFFPYNCSNRQSKDFNINNPVVWNNLWAKALFYNQTSISGDYLAWPNSSLPWTVSLGTDADGNNMVIYQANFTVDQFLNCAGQANYVKTVTDEFFIYEGTFYIIWVQPISPYLPGFPLTATYSTRSYSFPFAFSVSRSVDDTDGDNPLVPGFIYSYILELQWEYYQVTLAGYWYRLHLLLETRTPSTTNSQGTIRQYHSIQLLSLTVSNSGGNVFTLALNSSATDNILNCQVNANNYCVQRFSFWSAPVLNVSRSDNQTFTIPVLIVTCNQDMNTCTTTNYATSIWASLDIYLQQPEQINIVNQFSSTLQYYYNQSFTDNVLLASSSSSGSTSSSGSGSTGSSSNSSTSSGSSLIYFANQNVYFVHTAIISPIDPNFYSLYIENVYLCRTSLVPPYLGYDSNYGIYRYGCKYPETLNGLANIISSNIYTIVANETQIVNGLNFNFNMYRPNFFVNTAIGGSFSLDPLRAFTSSSNNNNNQKFYLDVESKLYDNDYVPSFLITGSSGGKYLLQTLATTSGNNPDNNDNPLFSFNQIQALGNIVNDDASSTNDELGTSSIDEQTIIGISGGGLFIVIVSIIIFFAIRKKNHQQEQNNHKYGIDWQAVATNIAIPSQV